MGIRFSSLLALVLISTFVYAQSNNNPSDGTVPQSVLEALGLSDLVQSPTDNGPVAPSQTAPQPDGSTAPDDEAGSPTPDQTTPEPDSSADSSTAAIPTAATTAPLPTVNPIAEAMEAAAREAELEALRALIAEKTADLEQAERQAAAADSAVVQRVAEAKQLQQELADARAAVDNVEQQVADLTAQAVALSEEGTALSKTFTSHGTLIERLAPVHAELKKVSAASDDPGVSQIESDLSKLVSDKQNAHAELQRELLAKSQAFEAAKDRLFAAHRDAEATREAFNAAATRLNTAAAAVEAAQALARDREIAVAEATKELASAEGKQTDDTAEQIVKEGG